MQYPVQATVRNEEHSSATRSGATTGKFLSALTDHRGGIRGKIPPNLTGVFIGAGAYVVVLGQQSQLAQPALYVSLWCYLKKIVQLVCVLSMLICFGRQLFHRVLALYVLQ